MVLSHSGCFEWERQLSSLLAKSSLVGLLLSWSKLSKTTDAGSLRCLTSHNHVWRNERRKKGSCSDIGQPNFTLNPDLSVGWSDGLHGLLPRFEWVATWWYVGQLSRRPPSSSHSFGLPLHNCRFSSSSPLPLTHRFAQSAIRRGRGEWPSLCFALVPSCGTTCPDRLS